MSKVITKCFHFRSRINWMRYHEYHLRIIDRAWLDVSRQRLEVFRGSSPSTRLASSYNRLFSRNGESIRLQGRESKGERGDKFYEESNLNPSSTTHTKPKMFNILKTYSGAYFTFPLRTLELLLLLLHFFPCYRLCPWIGRKGPFFFLEYLRYIYLCI